MQGRGRTTNSFSEAVNVDEGSSPDNTSTGQTNALGNMLNPVGTRLSDHTVSSGGTLHGSTITPDIRIFSGWNSGEPSSRSRLQDQVIHGVLNHHLDGNGTTIEHGWSSYGARAADAPRSEERHIEPPNVLFPGGMNNGRSGNQISSGPIYLQGSGSTHSPQSVNLTEGFISSSRGMGRNLHHSFGQEREQTSNVGASSDKVGSSSRSSNYAVEEYDDGSGSSLGSWGLSCKRKSLEGTSEQSYTAGTSSNSQQVENVAWHASSRSSLSAPSRNFLNVSPPVQLNPRVGLGMRGVARDVFPSSSANQEIQQESLPYSLSSTGVVGESGFGSPSHPRDVIAGNSSYTSTQPHMRTISVVPRSVHPFPWNGTSSSRPGNLSGSINSVERAAALSEEPNIRNIPRNNAELPMFVPETVMRHVAQDPTGWSLASEDLSTSGGVTSSNRLQPSSGIQSPSWNHPHNPPIHYQRRLSESSPWSVFPQLSSGPSASSQETAVPSRSNSQGNNRIYPRSASISERHDDDVPGMPHSLRDLAVDIEGRHRLISEIRQVLTAMRRGENLRVEDYMMLDPFIHHGMAETHDRHRDMRLDVDNMSYEELLALGEQIGDVSTGLNEETVMKLMKRQKYSSTATESAQELEPCCICQEEYANGDDTGMLNCGHDFHTNCIKQWLMLKNLCPICKTTGLLK